MKAEQQGRNSRTKPCFTQWLNTAMWLRCFHGNKAEPQTSHLWNSIGEVKTWMLGDGTVSGNYLFYFWFYLKVDGAVGQPAGTPLIEEEDVFDEEAEERDDDLKTDRAFFRLKLWRSRVKVTSRPTYEEWQLLRILVVVNSCFLSFFLLEARKSWQVISYDFPNSPTPIENIRCF